MNDFGTSIRLPPGPALDAALRAAHTVARAGYRVWFVGGCVRDLLLGRTPQDYDLTTDAPADFIRAAFKCVNPAGEPFGVFNILLDGVVVELARLRRDIVYRDGRHPERVLYTTRLQEDAARRDFTINAIYFDPLRCRIEDPVAGQDDLRRRVVRAIGDPHARMKEDYLRLIRAVRFATCLGFTLEDRTLSAVRDLAPHIARVSPERLNYELTRLLTHGSGRAGNGIQALRDTGLLRAVLPEVQAMEAVPQPPDYHPEGDVLTHTCCMLNRLESPSSPRRPGQGTPSARLAWAVLLHDVGKPATFRIVPDRKGRHRIRFDNHAAVGARIAGELLRRLRFPTRFVSQVTYMVRNHMRFLDVQKMRRSTLLRLVTAETFADELQMHRLDCLCSHGKMDNYQFLQDFVASLPGKEPTAPERWVTGRDILAMGVPEGPRVGYWLRVAREAQLEERFPDRTSLLEWLRARIRDEEGLRS